MRALVLLALGAAGPVWADCPVAADLETGIRFTLGTGEAEVFTAVKPHLVQSILELEGDYALRTLLGRGLYVLEFVDLENGVPVPSTRSTYSYPLTGADLPDPKSQGQWSAKVVALIEGKIEQEEHFYRFGAASQVTFGTCSYDMVPVTLTYGDTAPDQQELLHYLPDLGLAYLVELVDQDGSETYDYLTIEVVK